jgi:DNA-binding CsgD family transcriptional regulator
VLVIAESDTILVSINDARILDERLRAAVVIYGITPAQQRLAGLIIAGHDLVAAADQLGVSVSTARTHLQRMFDKTGVRSQPALVRALLTVGSPMM